MKHFRKGLTSQKRTGAEVKSLRMWPARGGGCEEFAGTQDRIFNAVRRRAVFLRHITPDFEEIVLGLGC